QEVRKDPHEKLAWPVRGLDLKKKARERAELIGYMPIGNSDSFQDGSNYFGQVINRYKDIIVTVLFGHTHLDHFQLSYSEYNNRQYSKAVAMSYICHSMTP
ncbi:hypothetical protein DER46DRAFT_507059, partial [Fusarium sp. MPI-SDFR-AT-0072]